MKGRMNAFDRRMLVFDTGTLSEPLCLRVWNIENELHLEGEGYSMSERISMIERNFNKILKEVEDMIQSQASSKDVSFTDRLIRLETELGVDQNGGSMFSRILTMKEVIDVMNEYFYVFERKISQASHVNKEGVSLHD
eukprot:9391363-Ditylum_brightwellii.AAC.1